MNNVVITSVLIPLFVAVIVSLITTYFSLRQFRKERVWDLKVETYDGIFSALYDLDEFWRNTLHEYKTGDEPEDWDEVTKTYNDAKYHVGEVVFKGEFIINKDAVKLLHRLTSHLDEKEPDFLKDLFTDDTKENFYRKQRDVLKKILDDLRTIAKKDVKV
ncbi:hypothetical protein KJ762_07930 [bacterium]|nr:hypothetical protein [bacterium]MBU1634421.1 hypothetical protein [bacterium]MBU1873945.1 hypothetical protein [bacterium]